VLSVVDVLFFRLLQWWILQASTEQVSSFPQPSRISRSQRSIPIPEQSTYLAMLTYHTSEYLQLRGLYPRLQQWLLVLAARSMNFTRWIAYPQKFIPIGFATYWLARMWTEQVAYSALGRFWLAWCVMLLVVLVLMQVWFCEE
jgi:hypothetical protein